MRSQGRNRTLGWGGPPPDMGALLEGSDMRHRLVRPIVSLCAVLLVGTAFWWLFIAETPTRPILHPETGYKAPNIADVKDMQVTDYRDRACSIPGQHWDNILDQLSPSERVPDEMVISMGSFGKLNIQLLSGQLIVIELLETGTRLWFCVREPEPEVYYYAGSLSAMEDALRAACDDSHSADSSAAKRAR